MPKPAPNPTLFYKQDGEPEIKVDVYGNIYITAINGVPGGVDLWKSTDKGATFSYLGQPDGLQDHCLSPAPQCVAAGGADDSIDVSSGGYLYVSSLYIGNVTISTSKDGGTGGLPANPDQAWNVNPLTTGVPVEDREWVAAYGPQTLYMTMRQAPGTGNLLFVKSTDAGKTFSAPTLLTSADSTEGNLVADPYTGVLYTTFIPTSAPTNISLLRGVPDSAGNITWTTSTPYTGPVGSNPGHKFTILAVDRGGNLHLVFGRKNANGSYHVYLMSSAFDAVAGFAGATWSSPVQVDSGLGNTTTAVMPRVVAGSPGIVDITWLGSASTAPETPAPPTPPQPTWNLFFAQTTNALAATPTFGEVQISTAPVHDKVICFNGGGCTGSPPNGTRDLLEYYTMALDPDGNANIAYADSVNTCDPADCVTKTWFTKQTSGSSAYAPPAGPAPATFAANVNVGAPGGEPGLKVDSHNCIFVTAPGPASLWKSINNGASFLAKVNPVAAFPLSGGDEDVLPIAQTSGARPDQLYFADLATLTSINIAKSTDGGANWFKPGPGGAAGNVDASSDRQWLSYDRYPTANDVTVYEVDHEAASEAIRFNALTNDGTWSPPNSGMTDLEFVLPVSTTFPNTNPGPVFVDQSTHTVYGIFAASTVNTNRANPPFGKMPNVWEAVGGPPLSAGAPPGPFVNHPVFKGVFDSPSSPQPTPPPGTATFGNNCANDFPSGAIDHAGNIYVVWAMNNARTNEYMVWFAASHDHGQNFYGPFQVSHGPGAAVMPWIDAGDSGRVEIVYYATTTSVDPNVASNAVEWNAMFAQSLNANTREPVFTISQVSDHINHKGPICNLGLLCPSGTRTLADFFQVAIGPDGLANVAFADNGLTSLHTEFARQVGGAIALTSPTSPSCLESFSIIPISAVSRKTHGDNGPTFDVNLPLTGGAGIECRSGKPNDGDHTVVISFANTVRVTGGASVGSSDGQATADPPIVDNQLVTVNLHKVKDAQTITITLSGVTDEVNTGNVSIPMGVLLGDVDATGVVTTSDVQITQSQALKTVTTGNFRSDVNSSNVITTSDVQLIKASGLHHL